MAVARLAADPSLRARFADDPVGTAASMGLNANDAAAMAQLNAKGLDRFAATLDRKELKRLRQELPQLCCVLGDRLPRIFSEFRNTQGEARRRSDDGFSIAFAAFVAKLSEQDLLARDIARLEGRCARIRRSWFPLRVCRICHRLDEIRESSRPGLVVTGSFPLPRLAIITRWNGRVRIAYLPLRLATQSRASGSA